MKREIICILAIFQIILLVNAIIAHPYIINEAQKSVSENSISEKEKDITEKTILLLTGIFSIKQIGLVSALGTNGTYSTPEYTLASSSSSPSASCCKELINGAICEDILQEQSQICKPGFLLQTECSQVSDCKIGCCVDPEGGVCNSKTPKAKCESSGGNWYAEQNCQLNECRKGCCTLGEAVKFVTEKNCEKLSLLYGFKKDFKDLNSEIACLALAEVQEIGACVDSSGGCRLKTQKECVQGVGEFYKDFLCSHPSLETSCTKQASVGCVEGKDEIYWFDSCGNRENIYSADKDASWNEGKILSKSLSCSPTSPNVNSESCGNCNKALSSVCSSSSVKKIKDGNFICKSLECVDENGKKRQNGESWCIYESYIGEGKDVVGSEHWRAYCVKGEVKIDRCGDYRGRICVQSDMESQGKKFSIATCAVNTAFECINYNSEKETMLKNCQENEYCELKRVEVSSKFSFDFCSPAYPKGFNRNSVETNKQLCSAANVECSVVYTKSISGSWKCSENCECETKKFSEEMNDICISLGDCGTYVNYGKKGTDNIEVKGASPVVSWDEYAEYAVPVVGLYATSQTIQKQLEAMLEVMPIEALGEDEAAAQAAELLGTVSGGLGALTRGLAFFSKEISAGYSSLLETYTFLKEGIGVAEISSTPGSSVPLSQLGSPSIAPEAISSSLGTIAGAAMGAAVGAFAGSWLAKMQGITGTPAMIMTVAGAVIGAIVGGYIATYGSFTSVAGIAAGFGAIPGIGWAIIIVMAVIMAVISLIGWGKTEIRTVSFECLPWEAPLGGDDCAKCSEDSEKQCTEYRCKSLGQACVLLNAWSETPICESVPKESVAPKIFPGITQKGYKFESSGEGGVKLIEEVKECIPEFTPVLFTLKTDEPSQCKFSFELPETKEYSEMIGEYPMEGNAFTENHTFSMAMPSLSSLSVYDVNGTIKEKFGKMSMYVRCQDYWGNYNVDEYIVNFCLNTGPDLSTVNHLYTKTKPENGESLPYRTYETNFTIYTNEPAECKYSEHSGRTYDEMEYTLTCNTDIQSRQGWYCNTTLTNLKKENKIYIKCKDQPWFSGTVNETNRNINQEDYEYIVYVSETPLIITSLSPVGKISKGVEPASIELEVRTSGGARNGIADCYWGSGTNIPFWETHSAFHRQTMSRVIDGEYSIKVRCEDEAKNSVESEINFIMELDTSPPNVARMYREGDNLIIITDEQAECAYTYESCDFEMEDAISMGSAFSSSHKAVWEAGKSYYVKCRDVWKNTNPWCSIKVRLE